MKIPRLAAVALTLVATTGCMKGESASPTGKAGTTGSSTGVAGTTGSSTGVAGTTSSGTGVAGTTGSSTGVAGTSSSGTGVAGTSGSSTGVAGTTGSGGTGTTNTLPATFAYLFNNSMEGWTLNNYADPNRKNLAAPDAGSAPTLAHDATAGNPDPGSLRATATFTDWKQYVDAAIGLTPVKNLTGRVVRARVRLVSGAFGGGVQIHASTGTGYRFAAGAWTTLTVGNWVELVLDLDAAKAADATYDPTMVIQLGVKFDTGGDSITSAFGSPVDPVFQIDTFSDGVVGGALPPAVNFTFDTDKQAVTLSDFVPTGRTNLGAPGSTAVPTLDWDGAVGSPAPGSLKLSVHYSDYKQYADAIVGVSSLDLTGKKLHALVRLDSGDFAGGVQMHVGTGAGYAFTASEWTPFGAGLPWSELVLDLATATTPGDVRQIGFQFDTGDPPEGGSFGSAVDAVFHIDSVTVQ